jgi:hypothetical protein
MPTPMQCQVCKHYGPEKVDILEMGEETIFVCRAFPKGIPLDILKGKPHTEKVNGFKFEPISGLPSL